MNLDPARAVPGRAGAVTPTRLQSSMKPGINIDVQTSLRGPQIDAENGNHRSPQPQPRRIPSSPSTPNLRSLSFNSSSSPPDDEVTPLATPLARSPEEYALDATPSAKPRNGSAGLQAGANIGRSRTMMRPRDGTSHARPDGAFDEFGMKSKGVGTRFDETEEETVRRGSSTLRESSRRGIPLNVDTRDLSTGQGKVPTDRTGDPIPFSAPGNSAYPSSFQSPATPRGSQFGGPQYSFTPSPTKTRHSRDQDQALGSGPGSNHHHHHLHRPARHHLQNHTSEFLPQDVAQKMQRWVQEVVVCNFDIDRGPIVERRMIGRPWGKGERANVAFSAFPDTSLFAEGSISYSFKIRQAVGEPSSAQVPATLTREGSESYFGSTSSNGEASRSSTPSEASLRGDEGEDEGGQTPMAPETRADGSFLDPEPDETEDQFVPLPHTPQPPHTKEGFFGPKTELPETPLAKKVLPTQVQTAEDYRRWDERGREWLYGFVWFCQKKDRSVTRGYMQRSIVILTHLPFPSLFLAVLDKVAPMYFDYGYPALEAVCYGFAGWPDPVPGAELQLPLLTDLLTIRLPDLTEDPQLSLPPRIKTGPETKSVVLASLPPIQPLRVFGSLLPALWHVWECMILGEPLLVIAPDPQTCSTIVWWLGDIMKPIPTESADLRPYLHIHDLDFRLLVNSNKPQPGVVVGVTNPFFRNAAGHWPNVISIGGNPLKRRPSSGPNNSVEHPQGFLSARKRHVSKDRELLKRLEDLVAEGKLDDPAGNEILRSFFIQLTEKMLAPLNRYVASLIPPVGSPEGIKPFTLTAFLHHLKAMAPNPLQFRSKGLTTKGKVETEFYTAFCKSPGFAGWLRNRLVSLTEAKWGPGQASRIPIPVINQSTGFVTSSPSASPLRRAEFTNNRISNDSSHRSSTSSIGWTESMLGRRGSDGGILSLTANRRPL